MKVKIFLTIICAAFLSLFLFSSYAVAQDAPQFNVKVLKHLSTDHQAGAEVSYRQNGQQVHNGTTGDDGWYRTTLPSGTYDVYVFYPPRPNDGQTGNLLNFYHQGDDEVTISLGANY